MLHGNYKTPSLTSHHLQPSKVLQRFHRFQSDNLTKKHLLEPPFLSRHVKNHHSRKISQNSSKYKGNRANVDKSKKLLPVNYN